MPTLSLPPDVVGAIFQFLKPAHVLDAAPTTKAWARPGDQNLSGTAWSRKQSIPLSVTRWPSAAPMHDASADAAVRNAL